MLFSAICICLKHLAQIIRQWNERWAHLQPKWVSCVQVRDRLVGGDSSRVCSKPFLAHVSKAFQGTTILYIVCFINRSSIYDEIHGWLNMLNDYNVLYLSDYCILISLPQSTGIDHLRRWKILRRLLPDWWYYFINDLALNFTLCWHQRWASLAVN